jgi:hypothetical protein
MCKGLYLMLLNLFMDSLIADSFKKEHGATP